jgi:hypothetical protein
LNGGKWRGMMDFQPRKLAVYDRVPHTEATGSLSIERPIPLWNGEDYDSFTGERPAAHGLGYSGRAVSVAPGSSVTYRIRSRGREASADSLTVELALAPNHPAVGETLRYAISVDGGEPQQVDYRTWDRSEEWKLNVLRNQAIRTTRHRLNGEGPHTLTITALDEGVIVDQIRFR